MDRRVSTGLLAGALGLLATAVFAQQQTPAPAAAPTAAPELIRASVGTTKPGDRYTDLAGSLRLTSPIQPVDDD